MTENIDERIKLLQNELTLLKEAKQKILIEAHDKAQIQKEFILIDNQIVCCVDLKFVCSFSMPQYFSNREFVNGVLNLNCCTGYDFGQSKQLVDREYINPNNFAFIKKLRDNAYTFRSGSNVNYVEFNLNKKEMENLTQLIWNSKKFQ